MASIFSYLPAIINFLDIYFNYTINEFPDYHKARLYAHLFSFMTILFPLILLMFICLINLKCFGETFSSICTVSGTIICLLVTVISAILSFIIQVYSIYLYFFYDGSTKIKNIPIKVLMWLSFIGICFNLCFSTSDFSSSLKRKKNNKNNNEDNMVELQNNEDSEK